MKETKHFFVVFAFIALLCMTFTSARASVDGVCDWENVGRYSIAKAEEYDSLLLTIAHLQANGSADGNQETVSVFKLPVMLQIIEDEAFEGTAAGNIELPENVIKIGARAFANNPYLRNIRIPETTDYIGENAFAFSHHVMISGAPGSYARTWARKNGILFSPITMFCAGVQNLPGTPRMNGTDDMEIIEGNSENGNEVHPVWRTGEIKAEFYITQIAHQVQGRSPPAFA